METKTLETKTAPDDPAILRPRHASTLKERQHILALKAKVDACDVHLIRVEDSRHGRGERQRERAREEAKG